MCTCTHVAVLGRNRILLHILTMLSRSKHCSTELPLRVGLICTALIHGHLPGTATHIKVLHTPSPSRSLSFPLSYPHHILIISSSLIHSLSSPLPPLLSSSPISIHPFLTHLSSDDLLVLSWMDLWSMRLFPEPFLSNRWCLLSMELLRSGRSSLFTECKRSRLPLLACWNTVNGSMWSYPIQICTHIRPIAYMDLCTRSLPPSILRSH